MSEGTEFREAVKSGHEAAGSVRLMVERDLISGLLGGVVKQVRQVHVFGTFASHVLYKRDRPKE